MNIKFASVKIFTFPPTPKSLFLEIMHNIRGSCAAVHDDRFTNFIFFLTLRLSGKVSFTLFYSILCPQQQYVFGYVYTINQSTSNETGFLWKKEFQRGYSNRQQKIKITQFAFHAWLFLKHIHLCLDDHIMCSFGGVYLSQSACYLFLSNKTFFYSNSDIWLKIR